MATCRRISVYVLRLPDGSLYVGSTAKTVRERLAEHRAQRGAGCRLFGAVSWCGSRAAAEKLEARAARRLRARGYRVTQG